MLMKTVHHITAYLYMAILSILAIAFCGVVAFGQTEESAAGAILQAEQSAIDARQKELNEARERISKKFKEERGEIVAKQSKYLAQVAAQEAPPADPEPIPVYAPTITQENAAYSLVKITLDPAVESSLAILTLDNEKHLIVIEAVETKTKGEFVFTGPPGKYIVRVTSWQAGKGFTTATYQTVIKPPGPGLPTPPVTPTDPEIPPTPVDPNTPSTGPPKEGQFGIGLVAYNWLVKNRPTNSQAVKQLAANYEWASKSTLPLKELVAELTKRNNVVYTAEPSLKGLQDVMRAQATRLQENGLLVTLEEFKQAYKETAIGIKAAYGE